jgi:hypothetical protein
VNHFFEDDIAKQIIPISKLRKFLKLSLEGKSLRLITIAELYEYSGVKFDRNFQLYTEFKNGERDL